MAAVAAPLNPIDLVHQVLGTIGMNQNVRANFITCHSISNLDDFACMKPEDTESVVKHHNDRLARTSPHRIGFVLEKKLRGWLFYYHDQKRRGNAIVPAQFTTAAMNRAINEYESFKQAKEEKTTDIDVDKIDTGVDWFTWKESFTSLLEIKTGVGGSPLARCIREDKPAGWTPAQATNPLERLIYELPLNGDEYEVDNSSTWTEIKKVTLGTPTYEWIRQYDATKDGRGAWLAILGKCEGDSASNKRIIMANKTVQLDASKGGAFYTNEYHGFTFDKYSTKLLKAYAIIERYRNYVAPETKVERLLAGINVQNAPAINNAKEYVEDHLLGD